MPIPTKRADESKDEFIQRCMSDDKMQEYDQDQRMAICSVQLAIDENNEQIKK